MYVCRIEWVVREEGRKEGKREDGGFFLGLSCARSFVSQLVQCFSKEVSVELVLARVRSLRMVEFPVRKVEPRGV